MVRTAFFPIVLSLLAATPSMLGAQDFGLPTPEEFAERAQAAERAPLFATHAALRMTLRTDIEWLRDERSDSTEVEGTLTYVDDQGVERLATIEVRARGNFRRSKRNCNFPPLRLDFPRGDMDGTTFEGQDKVKLVTPCNDGSDSYQNYIFDEYLAYRILNLLTPHSFRVRLIEITYEDIEDDYDTRTKVGFLIEADEQMAERGHATHQEVNQFHPARAFAEYSILVAMFNYMIGNTDWSPAYFHNVELVRTEEGRYLTVPYDFDSSGIVNPRYASVDPSLQDRIRRVTQRLYRGFCRPELTYESATGPFRETRGDVVALVEGFAALGYPDFDADDARDMLSWFDDFYEVVDDPGEFEDEILDECRNLDNGRSP